LRRKWVRRGNTRCVFPLLLYKRIGYICLTVHEGGLKGKKRAVRVIQIDPNEMEENILITAWMDTIELEEGQAAVDELVIYTVLTVETKVKCVALIEEWVLGEGTVEGMKGRIEELLG